MLQKILLSISYIFLFGLLGLLTSMPNHPPYLIIGLAFISLVLLLAYAWLRDIVSKDSN